MKLAREFRLTPLKIKVENHSIPDLDFCAFAQRANDKRRLVLAATTTRRFFVVMVMMLFSTATTTATFFMMVVMVMVATAATARTFLMVMMMVVTTATTATTGTFVFVMVVATTAATAATTATGMTLDTNWFKGFFHFGHFKTDHAEHLGNIRKRKHSKTFWRFSHFNTTVDQSTYSFLHGAKVTLDMKNLFNGRTNNPELAFVVNEDVINHQRTLFFNSNSNRAFSCFKSITPGHTFFRRDHELLGAFEKGLGRCRFRRQELGKGRHLIKS